MNLHRTVPNDRFVAPRRGAASLAPIIGFTLIPLAFFCLVIGEQRAVQWSHSLIEARQGVTTVSNDEIAPSNEGKLIREATTRRRRPHPPPDLCRELRRP